jgi:23S rRNA pseudouridine1911/1915/1917 synthase
VVKPPPPDPDLAPFARRSVALTVEPEDAPARLDQYVADRLNLSRAKTRALIDFGSVWVNGRVARRRSPALSTGDEVVVSPPAYGPVKFYEVDPARILYQDPYLVAYDKEAGAHCQQTPYDGYNHLYAALRRHLPGYLALHHRLDRPTSGVMVFGRRKSVNRRLGRMFQEQGVRKDYLAVVAGTPGQGRFRVDRPIARQAGAYVCPASGRGKPAVTEFEALHQADGRAWLKAKPLTGRTHQIRLHLAAAGLPIIGDPAHGGPPAQRLMLHAQALHFDHPHTGRPLVIEAPPPEGFTPPDGD